MPRFTTLRAARFLFAFTLFLSGFSAVFAASPFSDVSEKDDIYRGLLGLYQKGIVAIPADAKFHPEALMNRDEFVAIVVGVGCKKCLTPSTEDIIRYTTQPFADFPLKNQYFYCVSYAKEKGIVEWYRLDSAGSVSCQNGQKYSETPFCAENRITRIEAAAVLLRQAGLWSEAQNSAAFTHSKDISDADSYWYGYAQKALEIGIISYKEGTKILPDEYITKREFVKMAERFFVINLCELKEDAPSDFATDIRIVDKTNSCDLSSAETTFPNSAENTYSFLPELTTTGSGYTYEWEFVNTSTKTKKTETGKNLCSYTLPESGSWIVKLTVKDASGKSSIAYSQVSVAQPGLLSLAIAAKPLISPVGSSTIFTSRPYGGTSPYEYNWSFGDGDYSKLANPTHTYYEKGVHKVTLVVTDSNGIRASASLSVEVYENSDIDSDGILNDYDLCPMVFGVKEFSGCPRVVEFTPVSGKSASFLSTEAIGSECLASSAFSKGALFGESACLSCPCEYSLDFNAAIRTCDIVFPTILSPDKKNIYSRGSVYEIRAK